MYERDQIATLADEQVAWDWAKKEAAVAPLGAWAKGTNVSAQVEECYADNIERVTKEAQRLTRIAQKHNQPGPSVTFSPTRFVREVRFEEPNPDDPKVPIVRVRRVLMCLAVLRCPDIIGQDGWEVVAVLDHLTGGGNAVVHVLPGHELPSEWWSAGPDCDHCNVFRERNQTIIVAKRGRGGHYDFRNVGKSCLKEYTGIDPQHALALAAFYRATGMTGQQGVRHEAPLQDWLEWVAVAVRIDGRYISKATADRENVGADYGGGYSTSSPAYRPRIDTTVTSAHSYQQMAFNRYDEAAAAGEVPTDQDRALVGAVRAYVATLDPAQSTYHHNLVALFRADCLLWNLHGLAASAFAGYLREQRALAEATERAAQQRPSEYLGMPGERVELPRVKVVGLNVTEGNYGDTHIYRFRTPEGDKATWFSTNDMGLSVGQEVGLRGTVKKTEEYRGEKGTILTRCRILPAR